MFLDLPCVVKDILIKMLDRHARIQLSRCNVYFRMWIVDMAYFKRIKMQECWDCEIIGPNVCGCKIRDLAKVFAEERDMWIKRALEEELEENRLLLLEMGRDWLEIKKVN